MLSPSNINTQVIYCPYFSSRFSFFSLLPKILSKKVFLPSSFNVLRLIVLSMVGLKALKNALRSTKLIALQVFTFGSENFPFIGSFVARVSVF